MSHKQYTQQFREEACRLVTQEAYTPKKAAESLGIPQSTLEYWLRARRRSQGHGHPDPRAPGQGPPPGDGERDFKKSDGLLREPAAVRYPFIRQHQEHYPVQLMCDMLEVSRSGFYDWLDREPSAQAQRRAALTVRVKAAFEESRRTYGSPRITRELAGQGFKAARNTIAKIMRQQRLLGRTPKRFVPKTTDSSHDHPIACNTLDRQFAAGAGTPVWISDITYVPTQEGWLYLAAVMDLRTRRILGWAMAHHLRVDLVLEALHMALARGKPGKHLLHHSDRGTQYACEQYRQALADQHIACSMSRTGNCYDNAVMESFWATLKTEEVYRHDYPTRQAATNAIFNYIEIFYNRQRRHSALNYLSPEAFEASMN